MKYVINFSISHLIQKKSHAHSEIPFYKRIFFIEQCPARRVFAGGGDIYYFRTKIELN